MRTLLILTDFSRGARNGADLGMLLAAHLQARALLAHVYESPLAFEVKDPAAYPLEHQLRVTHDPGYQLGQEVLRLLQLQRRRALPAVPIECCSYRGNFHDALRQLTDEDVILAVTGNHQHRVDLLNHPNHVSESGHLLSCPLLVVPSTDQNPRDLRTIAFATDLARADLKALKWLAELSERIHGKLFTGHISAPAFNMSAAEESAAAAFMKGIEELGIPLYTYQNYFSRDIPVAIRNFCAERHADVLAVVYKKHTKLRHWLSGSTTAALLGYQERPLLLIPA